MIVDKSGLVRCAAAGEYRQRGRIAGLGVVDGSPRTMRRMPNRRADRPRCLQKFPRKGATDARTARRLAGRFHRMGAPAHRSGHGDRGRAGRHPHDRALVQGSGIRLRLGGRHGRDPFPPHEHDGRRGGRGRAPPRLCCHHARSKASVPDARPARASCTPDLVEPRRRGSFRNPRSSSSDQRGRQRGLFRHRLGEGWQPPGHFRIGAEAGRGACSGARAPRARRDACLPSTARSRVRACGRQRRRRIPHRLGPYRCAGANLNAGEEARAPGHFRRRGRRVDHKTFAAAPS